MWYEILSYTLHLQSITIARDSLLYALLYPHCQLQSDAVANHPNLWFQTSVNYHKLKNGKPITSSASSEAVAQEVPAVESAVKAEADGADAF